MGAVARTSIIALALLLLWPACDEQDRQLEIDNKMAKPASKELAATALSRWTFDSSLDGWQILPGTTGQVTVDCAEGVAAQGAGCLRWEHTRKAGAAENFGIRIAPVKLRGSKHVRITFHLRAHNLTSMILTAKTRSGKTFHATVCAAKSGWREVTLSTEALAGPTGEYLLPSELHELLLWTNSEGTPGPVKLWLDDFRLERDPGRIPPVLMGDLVEVAPNRHLCAGLSFQNLEDPTKLAPSLARAQRLGFGLVEVIGGEWMNYDKGFGRWDFTKLDAIATQTRKAKMGWVADIGGIINVVYDHKTHVPIDMKFDGDFMKLIPRYTAYLDQLFDRYGDLIRCFMFHSEKTGEYFKKHPKQLPSYQAFLEAAIAHVHKRNPKVQTGACLELDEADTLFAGLNAHTDVVSILIGLKTEANHWSYAEDQFARALALAGAAGKPLAIHEVGLTSSALVCSSEADQAQFVRELWRFANHHRDRIAWLTWWSVSDDDNPEWQHVAEHVIGAKGAAATWIREIKNGGLYRADGIPKPSAFAWVEGARAFGR